MRFGLDPVQCKVSRRFLLMDQVFHDLVMEGKVPPSRTDFIMSAIAWILELLVGFQYGNQEWIHHEIVTGHLKMKKETATNDQDIFLRKQELNESFIHALDRLYHKHS